MAKNNTITEDGIYEALKQVPAPDGKGDIVTTKMVSGLYIGEAGEVQFALVVDPALGAAMEELRMRAERAVRDVPGVKDVRAILTAEKKAPEMGAKTSPDPHGMGRNPRLENLPVKHIIAVASGKGGVGKSTIAFNLAYAWAQAGYKTGLLDADIYGPSIPVLSGLEARKPDTEDERILPFEAYGIKMMSMGFLNPGDDALIWRGPMVQTALYQLFRDVKWAEANDPLDVLIIDLPPGTGDAQLTLVQKVPVSGAVIVSTPQDLSLIDARKAVKMFAKTDVKVLGLIENMSLYVCPNCGHEDHIFGHGGAEEEAAKLGIPFLGALPLNGDIRRKSDEGQPLDEPVFDRIVRQLDVKKAA